MRSNLFKQFEINCKHLIVENPGYNHTKNYDDYDDWVTDDEDEKYWNANKLPL